MLLFRTAITSDVEQILALVNSAYRGPSSRKGWTTEADILTGTRTSIENLIELIEEEGSQIELAFEQGRLVACVALKIEPIETLYFGMLTVNPDLQACGTGKEMLRYVEQLARKSHCTKIRISVLHVRSELIAYYERRGFLVTGVSEPFRLEEAIFGKPLVSGLRLIEMMKDLAP